MDVEDTTAHAPKAPNSMAMAVSRRVSLLLKQPISAPKIVDHYCFNISLHSRALLSLLHLHVRIAPSSVLLFFSMIFSTALHPSILLLDQAVTSVLRASAWLRAGSPSAPS